MEQLLQHAAVLFQVDDQVLLPLRGGNFSQVYAFIHGGLAYVLRITPPNNDINKPAMESILYWMQHLADNGIPVPKPLRSANAELVEIAEKDGEIYLISAVEKAPGVLAETIPFEGWNDRLFVLLGSVTGKMHALSSKYSPPSNIQPRPQWDQAANGYNPPEQLDPQDNILKKHQVEITQGIQKLPRPANGYGLIHGDLHGANFFVDQQNDHITLFDFDDCCYGWYVMDIALPLLDFLVLYPGIERAHFAAHFLRCFLKGYLPQYPLDPVWLTRLPYFLRLLEIGLYAEVYAFEASVPPESWIGKFMAGRKDRIEQRTPFVRLDITEILNSLD